MTNFWFIDLTDADYAGLREVWGEIGIVTYCVNNRKGPSQSYMMIL